jgi:anti-sigma28 factor (negative regulator of flagellin synthesis)
MSEVGFVHNPGAASPPQTKPMPPQPEQRLSVREREAVRDDRVELSDTALRPDGEVDAARAMQQRIADIRARIAAGTYLTPDKLAVAIARLQADLEKA